MAVFLDFYNTEVDKVSGSFMAKLLDDIVKKHNLGDKITAVVTDTPSSMKLMWSLVQKANPKIFAMGCWAHVLNLVFKDFFDESAVLSEVREIKSLAHVCVCGIGMGFVFYVYRMHTS